MKNRILAGRYKLLSLLSRGGMGAVWRAFHLELQCEVAVKLISPTIARNPRLEKRFRREAKAAAALRGPHVVEILDVGVDGPLPFIVMELLEGESLEARLQQVGRLSPEDTARILTHVARAMSQAHRMGIVHRDLKPANIFLTRQAHGDLAKVVDFGVAKATREGLMLLGDSVDTDFGSPVGTPYYMSPEQIRGTEAVDHRVDIWAMAVIAFQCLTGELPFQDRTLSGLIEAICDGPAPVPSRVAAVPPGFDAWFARGTERVPHARFGSAGEAAARLCELCGIPADQEESSRSSEPEASIIDVPHAQAAGKPRSVPRSPWRPSPVASFGVAAVAAVVGALSTSLILDAGIHLAAFPLEDQQLTAPSRLPALEPWLVPAAHAALGAHRGCAHPGLATHSSPWVEAPAGSATGRPEQSLAVRHGVRAETQETTGQLDRALVRCARDPAPACRGPKEP